MKKLRLLIPIVLLLVAAPSYALCGYCDFTCNCVYEPGSGSRCRYDIDCCHDIPATCFDGGSATTPALAAEYTIASVEVTAPDRPDDGIRLAQEQPAAPLLASIAP